MIYPLQKAQVSFQKKKELDEQGQNSTVYLAQDINLNAEIVIKEIRKETGFSVNEYFREAQLLYKSAHPNVVQVNYACEDNDKVYIATPYYSKGSLQKVLESKTLTVREIIKYSVNILNGLHNIHSKDLIHFDIKPDNILISPRGEALISDFGLTQAMNVFGLAQQNKLYLKLIPPEAINNKTCEYDNRFDIYQMGLLMYRMCVGNDAFDKQFLVFTDLNDFLPALRRGTFPNRKEYPRHIPIKLRNIINKCLKIDPDARYGSALEVVNALADIDGDILDWNFSKNNNVERYECNKDGYAIILEVDSLNTSHAFRISDNGNKRRIIKYCIEKIDDKKIISFLGGGVR